MATHDPNDSVPSTVPSRVATYSKRSKKYVPATSDPREGRESVTSVVKAQDPTAVSAKPEGGITSIEPAAAPAIVPSRKSPASTSAVQAKETPQTPGKATGKIPVLSMVAIILAVFMAILDTSIVNVAIPKMMAVFGVTQLDIQWVLTAYTLVVGSLVPVTGYLGERLGYKKVFLYALAVFTIGSGLCGAAWSNGSMIFFRIVQAIGGGALMPVSMAMMFRMFPKERRGLAMGIFGIAVMFAPAIGPTLSGYIVDYLDWRLIFYINVPIGIINFFLAMSALNEVQTLSTKRFDLPGFIFSTIGFSTLLYGLGEVADKGWRDPGVVTYLAIAGISLLLFIIRELTAEDPMLDLRLFGNVTFTITQLISTTATVMLMGSLFIVPIFLQNIIGLSAVQTGLLLLPQAVMSGIMMPIAGALFDRIGARPLAIVGMLITATSLYLNHYIDVSTSNATLVSWFVLRAIGIGLLMMPVQTAGMNTVPMNKVGQGTAITNTVRQVAASFGIAWLALLLSQRTKFHSAVMSDEMNMFSPTVANGMTQLQSSFQQAGQTAAQAKTSAVMTMYGQIQIHSIVQAMDDIFFIISIVALGGAVLSLFLRGTRHKRQPGAAGEPAKRHVAME